jgi:hypothetical protein
MRVLAASLLLGLGCSTSRLGSVPRPHTSPNGGPATDISAPTKNYLLVITQRWGRTSPLGDLFRDPRDSSDVEVRLWGGYGYAGTSGVILRRLGGKWSAFSAQVHDCPMRLAADDTLTNAKWAELVAALARRGCHTSPAVGSFTAVYWLTLHELSLSSPPDSVWSQLLDAGVWRLPPHSHPKNLTQDRFTYVLEVRGGQTYRASVLPQSEASSDETDPLIRAIARILGFERESKP